VADPMQPRLYRILQVRRETDDTFTLEISPIDNSKQRFAPGQFNMLYVFGVGEVPISISSDPARAPILAHTTRVVGSVTKAMFQLKRGGMIGVRGPFGSAWPVIEAKGSDLVIIPGGIGLAPLRPLIYHVLTHRRDYQRVVVLYGARTPEDILYPAQLRQWRGKFDMDVHVTVDRATGAWKGNVGLITSLIARAPFDPAKAVVLLCGPEVMMRYTVMEVQKRGVPAERIYVSMERNMKCGVGFCGHCMYGPTFVCKDGPVFRLDRIEHIFNRAEI
jgi:NAD(P)H-flavin reductase